MSYSNYYYNQSNYDTGYSQLHMGIRNSGNTCYINSALECLRFMDSFRDILDSNKNYDSEFITDLAEFYDKLDKKKDYEANLKTILNYFYKSGLFKKEKQGDAENALAFVLEQVSEGIDSNTVNDFSKIDNEDDKNYLMKNFKMKSQIIDNFWGCRKIQEECENSKCKHRATFYRKFNIMTLFTEKDSLEETLSFKNKKEKCSKCDRITIKKSCLFLKFPKYLIISFDKEENYSPIRFDKTIKCRTTENDEKTYNLYGQISYTGNTYHGHYHSIIKVEGEVFEFNDSFSKQSNFSCDSRETFIIIYELDTKKSISGGRSYSTPNKNEFSKDSNVISKSKISSSNQENTSILNSSSIRQKCTDLLSLNQEKSASSLTDHSQNVGNVLYSVLTCLEFLEEYQSLIKYNADRNVNRDYFNELIYNYFNTKDKKFLYKLEDILKDFKSDQKAILEEIVQKTTQKSSLYYENGEIFMKKMSGRICFNYLSEINISEKEKAPFYIVLQNLISNLPDTFTINRSKNQKIKYSLFYQICKNKGALSDIFQALVKDSEGVMAYENNDAPKKVKDFERSDFNAIFIYKREKDDSISNNPDEKQNCVVNIMKEETKIEEEIPSNSQTENKNNSKGIWLFDAFPKIDLNNELIFGKKFLDNFDFDNVLHCLDLKETDFSSKKTKLLEKFFEIYWEKNSSIKKNYEINIRHSCSYPKYSIKKKQYFLEFETQKYFDYLLYIPCSYCQNFYIIDTPQKYLIVYIPKRKVNISKICNTFELYIQILNPFGEKEKSSSIIFEGKKKSNSPKQNIETDQILIYKKSY